MTELAGVVLAAGEGRRLRPLTLTVPKALCPVGGRPLLDLALDRLAPLVGSLAVNAHHHSLQIVTHLLSTWPGAHISVEQPQALGTAGALGALRGWIDERDVLLTNADAYLPDGLGPLVEGWDGRRTRLLVQPGVGRGEFDGLGYVGACLLPWSTVARLSPRPSGLYEVLWRGGYPRGDVETIPYTGTAIDCGTPADYARADAHARHVR